MENKQVNHVLLPDTLFDYATFAVRVKTSDTEAKNTNLTADANDNVRHVIKKAFSAKDITQTLVPGQPIASYKYRFREFKGNTTYPSNRTVVVQTECYAYVIRNETLVAGQCGCFSRNHEFYLNRGLRYKNSESTGNPRKGKY